MQAKRSWETFAQTFGRGNVWKKPFGQTFCKTFLRNLYPNFYVTTFQRLGPTRGFGVILFSSTTSASETFLGNLCPNLWPGNVWKKPFGQTFCKTFLRNLYPNFYVTTFQRLGPTRGFRAILFSSTTSASYKGTVSEMFFKQFQNISQDW